MASTVREHLEETIDHLICKPWLFPMVYEDTVRVGKKGLVQNLELLISDKASKIPTYIPALPARPAAAERPAKTRYGMFGW